ncbi:MAG: hypothetical protein ACK55I_27325, partial [bacterium]
RVDRPMHAATLGTKRPRIHNFCQRENSVAISSVNNTLVRSAPTLAERSLIGWQIFSQAGRTGCP